MTNFNASIEHEIHTRRILWKAMLLTFFWCLFRSALANLICIILYTPSTCSFEYQWHCTFYSFQRGDNLWDNHHRQYQGQYLWYLFQHHSIHWSWCDKRDLQISNSRIWSLLSQILKLLLSMGTPFLLSHTSIDECLDDLTCNRNTRLHQSHISIFGFRLHVFSKIYNSYSKFVKVYLLS